MSADFVIRWYWQTPQSLSCQANISRAKEKVEKYRNASFVQRVLRRCLSHATKVPSKFSRLTEHSLLFVRRAHEIFMFLPSLHVGPVKLVMSQSHV